MLSQRNREAVAGALLLLCAAGQERREGKPGAARLEQQARVILGELVALGQGITPHEAIAAAERRLAEIDARARATDAAIRQREEEKARVLAEGGPRASLLRHLMSRDGSR